MIKSKCTKCKKHFELIEDMEGKNLQCPQCGAHFIVRNLGTVKSSGGSDDVARSVHSGTFAPKKKSSSLAKWIFVLIVLGGAVAAGYYLIMISGSGVPKWAEAIMPADAEMIVYASIDKIRDSKLYKKIAEMPGLEDAGEIEGRLLKELASLGVKTELKTDDISEVMAVVSNTGKKDMEIAVALKMSREMTLDRMMSGSAVSSFEHNGRKLLSVSEGDRPMVLFELEKGAVAMFSNVERAKAAVDRSIAGKAESPGAELAAAMREVDANDFFIASEMVDADDIPMKEAADVLKDIRHVAVGVSVNGQFSIKLMGVCKDQKSSDTYKMTLDNGIAVGSSALALFISQTAAEVSKDPENEELRKQLALMEKGKEFLDAVKIEQDGNNIIIALSVKTDDLIEIMEDAAEMLKGLMGNLPGMDPDAPGMPIVPVPGIN